MENPTTKQVVEALKKANNVMVTVKSSPSVDELTAAVALTLILNRMNKHATTVFSGQVPSTIEFLQPEMAIESNTDSLRDFIISLDKSKADKLRYKVEDNVVRIFITPYKTSISDRDLEFSQGDFNVDVVVALGVVNKNDFDQAVTAHGRILHDATIIGVTKQQVVSDIGSINWHEAQASSISEMISGITESLGDRVLDGQIATALMTGMVAETDRFRNDKTTPRVLSLSSKLMTAGANQQLIAEKLEEVPPVEPLTIAKPEEKKNNSTDGMLEIAHDEDDASIQKIHIDEYGNLDVHQDQELPQVKEGENNTAENNQQANDTENNLDRPYLSNTSQEQNDGSNKTPVSGLEPDDRGHENGNTLNHSIKNIEPLSKSGDNAQQPINNSQNSGFQAQSTGLAPQNSAANNTPLTTQDSNNFFQQPSQPPNNSQFKATSEPQAQPQSFTPPQNQQNVSPPANNNLNGQTLEDLEKSVGSPHVKSNNQATVPSADLQQPPIVPPVQSDPEPAPPASSIPPSSSPTTVVSPVTPPEPKPEEPAHSKEDKKKKEDEDHLQPPPVVINPDSAPAVPPPIMPQAHTQPQFFEADGKKSNPFLNSKDH